MPHFCLDCETKKDCKKICPELERYLNKLQAKKGYSNIHYKRKTFPFDSHLIENLASNRATELRYGKKWVDRQYKKED